MQKFNCCVFPNGFTGLYMNKKGKERARNICLLWNVFYIPLVWAEHCFEVLEEKEVSDKPYWISVALYCIEENKIGIRQPIYVYYMYKFMYNSPRILYLGPSAIRWALLWPLPQGWKFLEIYTYILLETLHSNKMHT